MGAMGYNGMKTQDGDYFDEEPKENVPQEHHKENVPQEHLDAHYTQLIETTVAKVLKRVFGDEVIDKVLNATDESGNIAQVEIETEDAPQQPIKRKPVRKISERLNGNIAGLKVFLDTREIYPGTVVYVVDKVPPTDTVPYMTYKPAPRIITEVQDDNGVNNGTVFLTYTPKVATVATYHSQQHNKPQVISETDVIYSPLTKEHAEYVCKLLNVQSKQMYMAAMKQTMNTK